MEMGWGDFSSDFYPGDFGGGGGIQTDYGSPDPSAYSGGADVLGSYGNASQPYFSNLQADPSASVDSSSGGGFFSNLFGGGSAAPGAGGGGGAGLGGLGGAQGLLGLGGGLAGIIGALAGGGVTGTTKPQIPTNAMAQLNTGANQTLAPFAQGTSPLQATQANLLQSLASGQIPPGFAQLVANAYDPAYQDVATRATNAARQAGFFDNPLSSPVGGAIVGPAAAQLQGQQANSLLGLIQSLPQLFNAPIGNQIGAAQGQAGNQLQAAGLQTGQQKSVPIGSQIGTAIGGGLQGASQAIGQQNQQQMLGQLLQRQIQGQGGVNTNNIYGGGTSG